MSQVETGQEQLLALPSFRDIEHEIPAGNLPYVLAGAALYEVICLRTIDIMLNRSEYASRLRTAIDAAAAYVHEDEFDPPLPDNIAEKVLEFSSSLKHNDEVQRRQNGWKHVVDNGFYEFQTNRHDEEGMKAAELLLATVVHFGKTHTADGQTHLLDPLHVINEGKE